MVKHVVQTLQIDGTVMYVPRRDVHIDDEVDFRVDLGLVEFLFTGVRPDMGRVREEDPSRYEVMCLRLTDDVIKNLSEDVRPVEPPSICLADRRMVRHFLVHPEPEEPSVRQVRLDLFDGLADGPDIEQRIEEDYLDDDFEVDAGLFGIRVQNVQRQCAIEQSM